MAKRRKKKTTQLKENDLVTHDHRGGKPVSEPARDGVERIAKKNWHLFQNQYNIKIKEGDDVTETVPEHFYSGLIREGVI